ncbi:hypothetical protein BDF14DRAFT_1880777 [Spinellus fusiger]|nr:hypothetical protein BDF14DRAFT_1880777 [Spinellus fusiger]
MSVQQASSLPSPLPHSYNTSDTPTKNKAYNSSEDRKDTENTLPWLSFSFSASPSLQLTHEESTSSRSNDWEQSTKKSSNFTKVPTTAMPTTAYTIRDSYFQQPRESSTSEKAVMAGLMASESSHQETASETMPLPHPSVGISVSYFDDSLSMSGSRSVEHSSVHEEKLTFTSNPAQAQRSRSFAYGSQVTSHQHRRHHHHHHSFNKPSQRNASLSHPPQRHQHYSSSSQQSPTVYCALLSHVAKELRQCITFKDLVKNGIEYKNAFDGEEMVDKIALLLRTTDRWTALRFGRALGAQRFFHDVHYETRLLDSTIEIYQLDERVLYYGTTQHPGEFPGTATTSSSSVSDFIEVASATTATTSQHSTMPPRDGLPNGLFTQLTYCYTPTCHGSQPCYSYTCPKRTIVRRSSDYTIHSATRSSSSASFRQPVQELWANTVPEDIYTSVSTTERKRQEAIFELIYTEANFVEDLNYVEEMWIQPLMTSSIIEASIRSAFVRKVFSNILTIRDINAQLVTVMRTRQKEQPVISHIGDLLLEFIADFEPFIKYGTRQHEAKFELEHERIINPEFERFAQKTERHSRSHKLELNGYLTKPTTRLGRYTLLFNEILKYTPEGHVDAVDIVQAITNIKKILTRVNTEAGKAKNRFDLERIHNHLTFKHKGDEVDLQLLAEERSIIKQSTLRKSPNLDSTEYQAILFDHYFVVAKVKLVNAIEYYTPISVHFLSASLPEDSRTKRSSSILPYIHSGPYGNLGPSLQMMRMSTDSATLGIPTSQSVSSGLIAPKKTGYPIVFHHISQKLTESFILYASSMATRKPWIEKIHKQQMDKTQRNPVVELVSSIREREFYVDTKINHMITFNNGHQYLLATDIGVYVGHTARSKAPHKILSIDKATQVEVLESAQLLLVLADRILWEYALEVVNGKPETQPSGHKIQTHVPFFHVGVSLHRKLVCIPRVSALSSVISAFEPVRSPELKKHNIIDRIVRKQASPELHLKRFKDYYIPSEAWSVELSPSKMLITCPRGLILVDMQTDKPQHLLNPSDKYLKFITDQEENEANLQLRQSIKHIVVFRIPHGDYFVCYHAYGFYINSKGNRTFPEFLIEWEGRPEAFAFNYPYVIAFDASFIEIRNIVTGSLEQVVRGHNIRCLNNGHKTELPIIFGVMTNPQKDTYHYIFSIKWLLNMSPSIISA